MNDTHIPADLRELAKEDKKSFISGATSSRKSRYDLIPRHGLKCAADRFELGLERHPVGCYNALTNQKSLDDKEWLLERLLHVIDHAYKAIEKVNTDHTQEAYGDAGAIAFGGLVLGEAIHYQSKEAKDERNIDTQIQNRS